MRPPLRDWLQSVNTALRTPVPPLANVTAFPAYYVIRKNFIGSRHLGDYLRLFANYNIQDDNDLLRASDICILIITVMKGSSPDYPGLSCKDIRDITNSNRNGEYWIDPEGKGNPFKVYCDMTTDGGKFKKNIPTLFPRRPLHLGGVLELRVKVRERFECRLGNAFQPFQPFQPFQRILSLVR